MLSDRKAPEGFNSFRTLIRDLKRQCENKLTNPKNSNYSMALDLINIKNIYINNLILELNRNINTDQYKRLDKMIFINRGKVVSLNRKEIVNRDYKDLLKIQ
ncbi:MAG: hypothetical protein CR968_04615 [Flavobacteriia bacterium]|nr:MAG: hypothetical protein CR968_04615 [Flavobacteriia bacterium]